MPARSRAMISLVGLPGGGKSTVGRQLARRLGTDFVDTDAVLERELGSSIRSFFEREGEQRFRDLEETALQHLVEHRVGVLATGGGIVLRAANRALLHQHTHCVYLRATPDELYRRLRHDTHRPLLQVARPLDKLRELYQIRDPLYREAAHFVIETGRPSVSLLVSMVLMQLELAGVLPTAPPEPGTAAGDNPGA